MTEEMREMFIEFLKENLTLDVETESHYTGGNPLYTDSKTIKIYIDGELISSAGI